MSLSHVLRAFASFAKEMIKTTFFDEKPSELLKNEVLHMVQGLHRTIDERMSAHRTSWSFVHLACDSRGYGLARRTQP